MKQAGFSLIELIVGLAIIAILATIAVPLYSQFLAKGRIKIAQADLELMSLVLENRYQRVLSYPTIEYQNSAELQAALPQWIPSADTSKFNFTYRNPNANSGIYTVAATGIGGLEKDCVITLSHDGTKSISDCAGFVTDGSWL